MTRVKLVQLVDADDVNTDGTPMASANDLIARAHEAGLLVHTWTFRKEQRRLPSDYAECLIFTNSGPRRDISAIARLCVGAA